MVTDNTVFINKYIDLLSKQLFELVKANLVLQTQGELKDEEISKANKAITEKLAHDEDAVNAFKQTSEDEIARLKNENIQLINNFNNLSGARNSDAENHARAVNKYEEQLREKDAMIAQLHNELSAAQGLIDALTKEEIKVVPKKEVSKARRLFSKETDNSF